VTPEGYRARLYAAEWHCDLWLINGVDRKQCERTALYCTECIRADRYGLPRPEAPDEWSARMQAYLDLVFASMVPGPVSFE